MCYEIVKVYDNKHVRCVQYDLPKLRRLPEFQVFIPVIKSMLIHEIVTYVTVHKYQLSIERVS